MICLFFLAGVQQGTESAAAASRGPYFSAVSYLSVFSQLQMSSFELIKQHLTAANALFLHLSASLWVSPRKLQLNSAQSIQSGQSNLFIFLFNQQEGTREGDLCDQQGPSVSSPIQPEQLKEIQGYQREKNEALQSTDCQKFCPCS